VHLALYIKKKIVIDVLVEKHTKLEQKQFMNEVIVLKIFYNFIKTYMNIFDVIQSRRTIRKFNNSKNIDKNYLFDMIKLGSLHPSRMNKQPLEFIIIDNKQICNNIFSKILW
jgi:hypothetical protein